MSWTNWDDELTGGVEWDGMESCQSGDTVGMLLNLDEGTLTVYKNNRRLGVMKDGLSGPYCWFGPRIRPAELVDRQEGGKRRMSDVKKDGQTCRTGSSRAAELARRPEVSRPAPVDPPVVLHDGVRVVEALPESLVEVPKLEVGRPYLGGLAAGPSLADPHPRLGQVAVLEGVPREAGVDPLDPHPGYDVWSGRRSLDVCRTTTGKRAGRTSRGPVAPAGGGSTRRTPGTRPRASRGDRVGLSPAGSAGRGASPAAGGRGGDGQAVPLEEVPRRRVVPALAVRPSLGTAHASAGRTPPPAQGSALAGRRRPAEEARGPRARERGDEGR
ncbi:hypothetical protein THAOC_31564, partial [Thalassiosira oceanica]